MVTDARDLNNIKQEQIIATTDRIEKKVDRMGAAPGIAYETSLPIVETGVTNIEEEKVPPAIAAKTTKDVLSLDRVKVRCKSEATADEYVRINKDFNRWFDRQHKGVDTVLQEHIENYVKQYLDEGKSTHIVVAALKMQFKKVMGKDFNWYGLARDSQVKHEHRSWPVEEINRWISEAEDHPVYQL